MTRHEMEQPPFGFFQLFIVFILLLLLPPLLDLKGSAWVAFTSAGLMISSLYLVAYNKKEFVVGLLIALPVLLLAFIQQDLAYHLFYFIFLSYIARYIFRYLYESNQVTADMLFASICLYFFVGMIFAMLFYISYLVDPQAFYFSNASGSEEGSSFFYFSIVSLSTLGYGDILPVSHFARNLAMLETILGQFYLAFVVARLVGLYSQGAMNS